MSEDLPIPRQDSRTDLGETVENVELVQWGSEAPPRRATVLRSLVDIGRVRWVVPVIAALGTLAIFASLIGEWTIITISDRYAGSPGSSEASSAVMVGKVSEVASFGSGYLVGVLALLSCLALVLFGTPGSRHNARVLGLATSGGLLILLVGATAAIKDQTERQFSYGMADHLSTALGRGLIMAYVGTAVLGLALLLAGRFLQRGSTVGSAPGPMADEPSATSAAPGPEHDTDWPWRRSRPTTGADPQHGPPENPLGLTVGPTAPFARPEQQESR